MGRGTTGPHPKGGTKWLAAAGGFFASRCKAGMAGGGKKSPGAVAGRRAGFGQTSLSRGRVGGGAVQKHGPDGMIGGALPPADRGGAGDGSVPKA
tara:strand:+ start:1455 stop:1739 length:285 start_codon:yes stop_codon:yes gene_type:complete